MSTWRYRVRISGFEWDDGNVVHLALGHGIAAEKAEEVFAVSPLFIGDPPGTDLDDRMYFDIGFSRALDPRWTVSAFYEESNTLIKNANNIRDITVNLEYKADQRTKVFFGGTVGLTETSPDYGLIFGASFLL